MKVSSILAWMAIAVVATVAQAQTTMRSGGIVPSSVQSPYFGGYPVQSSTPLEGMGRGLGDVVRSIGDANLSNSAAALNLSEFQLRAIENRKQSIQTYFAMRDFNRQQREAEISRQRGNPADFARYAQAGKLQPLTNFELDAVTGEIRWPLLLTASMFDAQRAQLEKLFANRAYHGVLRAEDYLAAVRLTGDMIASLKDQIHEVPPQQYLSAKRFLEGLTYEASLATG
jgi:hypothetical protein